MLRRATQTVGRPLTMFQIVLIHDEPTRVRTKYRRNLSYGLGYIQMLIGIACVVIIVASHPCNAAYRVGACVVFFFTGILCLVAAKQRKGCSIMCMIFFSMISIPTAAVLTFTSLGWKCQMNAALIPLVVTDLIASCVSIWIGFSSMPKSRQPSSSEAMTAHAASDGTGTHLTGDFIAVVPPCQMSLPTAPSQQSALPAYSDVSPGLQSPHIEKPDSTILPRTPPQYTPLSDPCPAYSETVETVPSSEQSLKL